MTNDREERGLTHLREDGSAHMVDVTDKQVTRRTATAQATLHTRSDVVRQVLEGDLPKGEALGTARVAGIMAAKRTSDLIPLCHPLPLTQVAIDFSSGEDRIHMSATVMTKGVTGVEMEALTAVSVTALTIYDMLKAVDRHATISDIRVVAKSGGKSGDWTVDA